MTDGAHSSGEEMEMQQITLESAALLRKKRLNAMKKSIISDVDIREEDSQEDAQPTKKSRMNEKSFSRNLKDLDVVEKQIQRHLEVCLLIFHFQLFLTTYDTTDTKPVETVDITTLAPKKIDWDLKRDNEKTMQTIIYVKLERRTQKCIVDMIRKRLTEGIGDLVSAVNANV
uniref:MH2 domain-containing protein n=1 Tax=Heterorhabditis bacteriophora TaxID=37862 RepID=A0A1I7WB08_HETBA